MLKLAKVIPYDPEAAKIMDEADHAAVRGITRYLTGTIDDVTPERTGELRRSFKFNFPWDTAVSRVELVDIDAAIRRESARGSVLKFGPKRLEKPNGTLQENECVFQSWFDPWGDGRMVIYPYEVAPLAEKNPAPGGYPNEVEWGGTKTKRAVYPMDPNDGYYLSIQGENLEAKGAINPANPNEIVDHVSTIFNATDNTEDGSLVRVTEFWLSRESQPRLLLFKTSYSRLVFRDTQTKEEWDLVPAPDQPTRTCTLVR